MDWLATGNRGLREAAAMVGVGSCAGTGAESVTPSQARMGGAGGLGADSRGGGGGARWTVLAVPGTLTQLLLALAEFT